MLNLDKTHFVNSNDVCTPMSCVEEMVDAIPEELWNRESIDVLDPCCGNGNFPAYVKEKSDNCNLFLNEINGKRIENVRKLFNEDEITLTQKDFFSFTNDKLYDLIIANPPYARIDVDGFRAAKNHGLSKEFVKKSLSLLKDNGYLVYIIPDNWMSLSDRNDTVEILSKYQFIHLNIHGAKKYFPGIGSSFTWFVLRKEANKRPFYVENNYIKNEYDVVSLDVGQRNIPLFYNYDVKSIIDKTLNKDNEKMMIETTSDLHKYTKRDLLSTVNDNEFIYPIWHTQSQKVYSKRKHKYQDGWKLFISLTSYFRTFIDEDHGTTQSIAFIRCEGFDEALLLHNILKHPLDVFLNNIHRYGNFNNVRILQKFPMPKDPSDIWGSFNITDSEKELILSIVGE
jgi:SAM-dependent methyltransferase